MLTREVEVSKTDIKAILAKIMNTNWSDWARNVHDTLLAYQVILQTYIGMSPYQLVCRKKWDFLRKLDHKELWALTKLNLS